MPRLTELFPESAVQLASLSTAERYILMAGDEGFRFKARGVSVMLDRQKSLEGVMNFLQIAAHIPGILQRLNVDAVLEEITMALGWAPQKMILQSTGSVTIAGQPTTQGAPFPPPGTMTPMQEMAGQMGGQMGGAPGNPMAGMQAGPQPTNSGDYQAPAQPDQAALIQALMMGGGV
jgi:hypothetical protein